MYKLDLEELHHYYKANISRGNHPISLELANYLYDLCWKIKPKMILDKGSGFSSLIFRKYSIVSWRDVKIYTVDNDAHWLKKTKRFLNYCGLTPNNLYLWPQFLEFGPGSKLKFDLILDDYYFPTRTKTLHLTMEMLNGNGYLILDDANNKRLKSAIARAQRRFNIDVNYLLDETRDDKDRYSALIRWRK